MKFLLTKDMYVSLKDFDEVVAQANRLHGHDLVLCVSGAYRMVDGKPEVLNLDALCKRLNIR